MSALCRSLRAYALSNPACLLWAPTDEGGGIYRKTFLVRTPPLHLATDGIYARSTVHGLTSGSGPNLAAKASVAVSATVENTATTGESDAKVVFDLFDAIGTGVGSAAVKLQVAGAANSSAPATASGTATLRLSRPARLWAPAHPVLYTLRTRIGGDEVNTSVGIRSTNWSSTTGFWMNEEKVKIRGFCNHNTFGGLGMNLPDRVNLFRAQVLRGMGANAWRTAHNPPEPGLLDILDRVGVMAMDENRIFTAGTTPGQFGFGHGADYGKVAMLSLGSRLPSC